MKEKKPWILIFSLLPSLNEMYVYEIFCYLSFVAINKNIYFPFHSLHIIVYIQNREENSSC